MTAAEAERILREALYCLLGERSARGCSEALITDVHHVMDTLDFLMSELARKDEALREDVEKWSFGTLVVIARQLLAENYPPDIFDGSSGDPGPLFVVKLREALAALPEDV